MLSYFYFVLFTATSLSLSINTITQYVPCIPQSNPHTCTLTWTTNSGSINRFNIAVAGKLLYSKVDIYSPECTPWGLAELREYDKEVTAWSWGLSLKHPPTVKMVDNPSKGYGTPVWVYDGKTFDVQRCKCQGVPSGNGRIDTCVCTFDCVPFPPDLVG